MTAADGAASLEESCRRVLRWFPRQWRNEREAELLEVLVQATPPGRRRLTLSEVVSLAGLGVRVWAGRVVSPHRETTRDSMSILAVGLPVLLMFPAASAIALGARWPWSPSLFTVGIPGWLLWIMTMLLALGGSAVWAGRVAVAALVTSLAGEVAQLVDRNFRTVAMDGLWIGAQLLAVAALADRRRILRGRELLRPRMLWVGALSLTALGAVYGMTGRGLLMNGDYDVRLAMFFVALGSTALTGVALLSSRRGRALLPILGALAAMGWATRRIAGQLGNFSPGMPSWLQFTPDMLMPVITVPVMVFVALRLLTAAVGGTLDRRKRSLITDEAPPTPVV